jgi:hypothetical protein
MTTSRNPIVGFYLAAHLLLSLAAFVKAHVLSCFSGTPRAGFQTRTCGALATRPGALVEDNAITRESFQDMVDYSAIIQMFSPVGEHTPDDLFALELSHNPPHAIGFGI